MAWIALEENVEWGGTPRIYFSFYYEKVRDGANMKYRTRTIISPLTGQNTFGYYIAQQLFLNGESSVKEDTTLKSNSPNQWSSSIEYISPWYTINNKTTGSTQVTFGIYTNSGRSSLWKTYYMLVDPAYPTGCTISFNSKTLNSIKIDWSCNQNCSQVRYRLNGGSWVNTLPEGSSQSRGNFNITGLAINTSYLIECDFQRADSGMWSSHNTPADIPNTRQTTYNKATISSAPNLNLGDTETIQYNNPSGNTIKLSIQDANGTSFYCQDRTVTGTSYTFNFTDEELDTLFKAMGTSNSLNARVYLKTFIDQSNYYYDYAQITITLTGNQKTICTNVEGNWKRGKIYINVEGTWKRGVVWRNVEGTWKRCI